MKLKQNTTASLVIFALLLGMTLGLAPVQVARADSSSSQGRQKVGADLKKKEMEVGSCDDLDVIIQPTGSWTSSLDSDLNNRGAVKKPAFKNFGFRAVRMKAKDVDSIASRSDVAYMSLDRSVKLLGHLSLTTGADAARALGGSTAYDGTGIGIAVLDSGVYSPHKDLLDSLTVTALTSPQSRRAATWWRAELIAASRRTPRLSTCACSTRTGRGLALRCSRPLIGLRRIAALTTSRSST